MTENLDDFDLVLFNDPRVTLGSVMKLLSKGAPLKHVIAVVRADSKFMDCRDGLTAYIKTLTEGATPSVFELEAGYVQFKTDHGLDVIADKHGVDLNALTSFVQEATTQCIVDEGTLGNLFGDLHWKARGAAETSLMKDLLPRLPGVSGIKPYL